MDAFVKFLLDYYIWILAVLGIVIVTIIGFLVDSKQKRKKKETNEEKINDIDKQTENIPSISEQNSLPIVDTVGQSNINKVESTIGIESSNVNNINNNVPEQQQNPELLNNQNNNLDASLSAQKPHFAPSNVNIPVSPQPINSNLNNQIVVPQPVKSVPINQPVQQPVYSGGQTSTTTYQNPTPSGVVSNQQYVQNGIVNNIPNVQPTYQNNVNVQPQAQPTSNVTPQGSVNNLNNSIEQVQTNYQNNVISQPQVQSNIMAQVPTNNLNNPIENIQPVNSNIQNSTQQIQNIPNSPSVGMNFVTGPQQVSNPDDMWKL